MAEQRVHNKLPTLFDLCLDALLSRSDFLTSNQWRVATQLPHELKLRMLTKLLKENRSTGLLVVSPNPSLNVLLTGVEKLNLEGCTGLTPEHLLALAKQPHDSLTGNCRMLMN